MMGLGAYLVFNFLVGAYKMVAGELPLTAPNIVAAAVSILVGAIILVPAWPKRK